MRNPLYNFLRIVISIVFTQKTGNTIHASLFKFKNKYTWFYRSLYGTTDDEDIFNHILKKLDGKFDILMIHSSFNNMIPMYTGNLNKLISMIISYCERKNITLVMPAFFDGTNYQAKEYYENGKHAFDVNKTISGTGLLSELFRRTANVKRSIHPTHSICAVGPLADKLVGSHHLADTTFGEGTPFFEMIKYRTMILGLGTEGDESGTQIHSAEDIMKEKFPITLYSDIIHVTCIDEKENKISYNLRVRKGKYTYDSEVIHKIFGRIAKEWTYKGIPFFLTEAKAVTEAFLEAAKKGQTIYKRV